ncbi:MAG: hypothetical protein EPO26_00170 [Chloroflexota bacterium]|nr:MAG: hypothetical protein EPO26_00170 [Chloroflexota bacterium]
MLKLAATTLEIDLERALAEVLATGGAWDDRTIAAGVQAALAAPAALATGTVDLADYDALLCNHLEVDDDAA